MTDEIWKRDEVASPCVKLCSIHPVERICVGCLRTLEEIGGWSALSNDERRAVMATLPERAPRLAQRRGGRRAKERLA
ncbi:MAG: DUF1289 domain-containing protein [Pseudomonadota bacterium]